MSEAADRERANEELQMRRLNMLRRILQIIVCRWIGLFLAVFLIVASVLTVFLVRRAGRSLERAVVTTKLQFYPKNASKIAAMDDKQVFQVLSRETMTRAFIKAMGLRGIERMRARMDISLKQDRKNGRLFEITAKANNEERAVEKANCYADLCLKEYETYRRAELENWMTTIYARRQELLDQIAAIDAEEQKIARQYGVLTPQSDVERLRATIADQKVQLSATAVKLSNEELRVRRYTEELKGIPLEALDHTDELKELQEGLKRSEAEIARLRELYTDKNPRLAVVLRTQQLTQDKLNAFLARYRMPSMNAAELDRLAVVSERLREAQVEYDVQKSSKEALLKEIVSGEKLLTTLVDLMPQFERFRRQRDTLQSTIQGLEETISDIRYQQASVAGDLTQVERAEGGKMASPHDKKNYILGFAGGFIMSGGLLFWIALIDFIFGSVRSLKEVEAYMGLETIGPITEKEKCPKGIEFKDVLDRICFRLENTMEQKHVLFSGLMPGGGFVPALDEAMDWSATMSGQRILTIDIVLAKSFDAPENIEMLSAVYLSELRGWFPIANLKAISPSEMRLLGGDLALLRQRFDTIVLRCPTPVASNVFLRQILEISEASVFYVGARQTPRTCLRRLASYGEKAGKEPMVIVSGRLFAKDFAEED